MQKIWFSLIVLVSFLVPLGVVSAAPPTPAAADAQALLQTTRDDRILGKPDAPITIIEYASLTCPHCAHFQDDVLPEIKKQWIDTGKAKLVLRDFPLDEEALRAAMIARCAPPDRYYAFVDTFFGAQSKWVGAHDYREALARLARLGGMSKEEFDACLSNKGLEDSIVQSRFVASKQLDVNSTPTFFINGTKYTGAPTVQDFATNLQAAFAATAGQQTAAPSTMQTEPSATTPPPSTETTPTPAPAPSATHKPSSELTVPSTQAPHNVAAFLDAGHLPESTIWNRLQGWFQGLLGSHS
ncbi:MAG: DsbA family protein [Alphaproteobacteria bacterium]|nr:DsbA family protein [Alphaproteobacteria bacterium]